MFCNNPNHLVRLFGFGHALRPKECSHDGRCPQVVRSHSINLPSTGNRKRALITLIAVRRSSKRARWATSFATAVRTVGAASEPLLSLSSTPTSSEL